MGDHGQLRVAGELSSVAHRQFRVAHGLPSVAHESFRVARGQLSVAHESLRVANESLGAVQKSSIAAFQFTVRNPARMGGSANGGARGVTSP